MKNQQATKQKKPRKYSRISSLVWALKRLWKMDRVFFFWFLGEIPVAVALPLVSSYFSKVLIDRIGAGVPFRQLLTVCLTFLGTLLTLQFFKNLTRAKCRARRYYPTTIYQSEMCRLRYYSTDYENTEKQDFKEVFGYAQGDACHGNCAAEYLWQEISRTLIDTLGIVTYGSLIAVLNPIIFIAVAVLAVLTSFTTRIEASYREKHKHECEKEIRKKGYLHNLSDNFAVAKDIKLYNLQDWLDKMMRDYQTFILLWERKCSLRGLWAAILAGLMSFAQNAVVYLVLIERLLNGGITVGEFVFYFGIVSSIAGFLQGIGFDVAELCTRADKIAYYRELFDYPTHFNHGKGCALPQAPVTIELRDVWYRYDGASDYTLKGINLTIQGGESLALVGINGAGKTTLIKLICGMYTPTKGEILVGGRHIREYNIEEYYTMISAVFQNLYTPAFTCFEFVASYDPARPNAREEAIEAMKKANIYDKIASLTNGIDTHLVKGVYDDGVDLSGGELQKLVLARAIYKNGSILVLDEPTSALDPIAENKLYLQYRELTRGKTSLYISHRFASTRFCDRIVLLENGVIQESGTHEELMRQNGRYAYMFGVQSKYYQEGMEVQNA